MVTTTSRECQWSQILYWLAAIVISYSRVPRQVPILQGVCHAVPHTTIYRIYYAERLETKGTHMSISFDRIAERYDATRGFPPGIEAQIGAAFRRLSSLHTGARLLEIGVGTGRIA